MEEQAILTVLNVFIGDLDRKVRTSKCSTRREPHDVLGFRLSNESLFDCYSTFFNHVTLFVCLMFSLHHIR